MSANTVNTKAELNKWGEMFKGEPLVDLFIPKDKINPVKQIWLMINGQEIWLKVGESIKVPKSVYDVWQHSYSNTLAAEEKMANNVEIM